MELIEKNFWIKACDIYKELKRLYIMAEEYGSDFSFILQPIKEQRDSLDHIIRAYSKMISAQNGNEDSYKAYIEDNFSKAIGHLYRSYYDTADILTIILREKISNYLSLFTYSQIVSVWKECEYKIERNFLITVNKQIAGLRLNKDVAKSPDEMKDMFNQYRAIIEHLFSMYDEVLIDLYPRLALKYNK